MTNYFVRFSVKMKFASREDSKSKSFMQRNSIAIKTFETFAHGAPRPQNIQLGAIHHGIISLQSDDNGS